VLIVDDDIRNIFALTGALEQHGITVLNAENGKDGLEALKNNPGIDVVLMDIMMPELDGYDTIRIIRRLDEFKNLPVIAVTAKAMKGIARNASRPAPRTTSPSPSISNSCCRCCGRLAK